MSNLQLTQEKLDALRSEYRPRRPCAQLKYPRPKTKPEYQSIYPWLLPDETDPHFVFCAVCECRLSAKRSDLGKHEGSMKHSENAQRKAKVDQAVGQWEYNDDDEAMLPFEANNENDEDDEEEESAEAEGDEADPAADDDDVEGEPPLKQQRRISESDSQHSGMLDFLPLQVTINEMPHCQLSGTGLIQPPPSTTPQPCRITIKKVPALLAKTTSTTAGGAAASAASIPTAGQSHEISSKATITPIAPTATCYTPSSRQPQMYATRQLTMPYQLSQLSPQSPQRDSLELFFDSICATVKSLPPKLATEGKIRVMQLIGELELRAISEQEEIPVTPPALDLLASAAAAAPDGPGCSQQNATVASTTK
ncbi:protein suppressor of variegation 3-7 [Drosophila tropicalis]|uniref:protein suppressor of variegation 3-7 n=1 Tax=Drosophila tropicalis TaxID=46794 RepID=UPI0035ABDB6C